MKYVLIIEDAAHNYSAFSPDLPGCIATGSSVEEALQEWKVAATFHLEGLEDYPTPKGLKYWLSDDQFSTEYLSSNNYFTEVDVELPIFGMVADEG
jgi:predicted RNase H-like HicB family nuclease